MNGAYAPPLMTAERAAALLLFLDKLEVQISGSSWYNQKDKTNPERYRNTMISILFICHGNICRSPMAEFVMKEIVRRGGEADRFSIASCAVSREEIGSDIHAGTRRKLREMGIPFERRAAVQLTRADYDRWD